MLFTYVFAYLAEKEIFFFEVREREWLLDAEREEEKTKPKLKKGKIYKSASVFKFFSTQVYPRDPQHRV